jgi:hypothetical protein
MLSHPDIGGGAGQHHCLLEAGQRAVDEAPTRFGHPDCSGRICSVQVLAERPTQGCYGAHVPVWIPQVRWPHLLPLLSKSKES